LPTVERLSPLGLLKTKVDPALRLPPRSAWRHFALEATWSLPLALLLCALGGLADFGWTESPGLLLRLAAVALVAPAFGEELLFRVLVLPRPGARAEASRIALSAALFMLWHPPQAWLFGTHWAAVVLNPFFLAAVAVLGVALGRLYARTGSIWPCVLLHWTAVVGWKALFGAPSPWLGG
jgi:predicted Abi (CAAX) family protease